MKQQKYFLIPAILLASCSQALAADNAMAGVKLGFGFDQGLGLAASFQKFNGFIGNDGIAVDYIIQSESFKVEVPGSTEWYVAAGAYHEWDENDNDNEETGVRLPVGIEWQFADRLDAFVQLAPKFDFRDTDFGLAGALAVRYQF